MLYYIGLTGQQVALDGRHVTLTVRHVSLAGRHVTLTVWHVALTVTLRVVLTVAPSVDRRLTSHLASNNVCLGISL